MRNEIVHDLSFDDYADAEGYSPSQLVCGFKSMLSLNNARYGDKPTPAQLAGLLRHTLILEPDKFNDEFIVADFPNRLTKAYKEFAADNEDKHVVLEHELRDAMRTVDAVMSDSTAHRLLEATKHEAALFVEDLGLQCKGRVDGYGNGILLDLKTTTTVEPQAFGRIFANLHYAARLACYRRWLQLLGETIDAVYVIACEVKDDYDVVVYHVPEILLENAWQRVDRIMRKIPNCEKMVRWPGVSCGAMLEVTVPNWAMEETDLVDWSE